MTSDYPEENINLPPELRKPKESQNQSQGSKTKAGNVSPSPDTRKGFNSFPKDKYDFEEYGKGIFDTTDLDLRINELRRVGITENRSPDVEEEWNEFYLPDVRKLQLLIEERQRLKAEVEKVLDEIDMGDIIENSGSQGDEGWECSHYLAEEEIKKELKKRLFEK